MSIDNDNKEIIEVEDNDQEYEEICYICRRPESIAGALLKIPGNICICKDCMQKTIDTMQNVGFNYDDLLGMNRNTNKVVATDPADKAKEADNCRVYPIGAATKGIDGEQISEMGLMKEAGIVAVSDDGHPIKNAGIMRKVLEYSSDFDLPVLNHCEDKSLSEGAMNEGEVSTSIGIRGIPTASEDIMIARDIILSEYLNIPVHICHVSTKGGVRMIRDAKARGVKVTCETCPHYFTLTDDKCIDYDTNYKMHPPLRTEEHRLAIIEGLKDGTIDAIATDNAPHHADEKVCEFSVALNGILGFETAFALGYTYLVKTGEISLEKLIDLMCYGPSKILKLGRGGMNVGDDADLAVFDLDHEFTFEKDKMLSKSRNTPYDGWKLYGETILTIMGGKVTYEKLC